MFEYVKWLIGLGTTVGIVVGITLVALTASQGVPTEEKESTLKPIVSEKISRPTERAILLVEGDTARLVSWDGQRKRILQWPEDAKRLGKPLSQIRGISFQTGQDAWLDAEFKYAKETVSRSPDGRRELKVAAPELDGAGAVAVKYGDREEELILYLDETPVQEVRILGWLSPETFVITGTTTGLPAVFEVSLEGKVSYRGNVPEDANLIRVADGTVFYATAGSGDEIEFEPLPPSVLGRLDPDGATELVRYEQQVVAWYAVSHESKKVVALMQDDGELIRLVNGDSELLGVGMPLWVLMDGTVLAKKDGALWIMESEKKSQAIPLNGSEVWLYPLEQADLSE